MLRVLRLPVVRLCPLFLAAVLSSAIVLALAASADPSRAGAALLPGVGVSVPGAGPVSRRRAKRGKSSAARRARCAAAARAGGHRKARKACGVKKAKAHATKPSVSPKPAGTKPSSSPSVAPPSTPAAVIGGPLPPEVLKVEPVAPTPPVEEVKPPVEESKPPVEESQAAGGRIEVADRRIKAAGGRKGERRKGERRKGSGRKGYRRKDQRRKNEGKKRPWKKRPGKKRSRKKKS